jgi:hypothetical protein
MPAVRRNTSTCVRNFLFTLVPPSTPDDITDAGYDALKNPSTLQTSLMQHYRARRNSPAAAMVAALFSRTARVCLKPLTAAPRRHPFAWISRTARATAPTM